MLFPIEFFLSHFLKGKKCLSLLWKSVDRNLKLMHSVVFIKLLFWHAKRKRGHFSASLNSPSRNPSPEFIFCASISLYDHKKLSEQYLVIVDSSSVSLFHAQMDSTTGIFFLAPLSPIFLKLL